MKNRIKILSSRTEMEPSFLKKNVKAIAELQKEIATIALSLPEKPKLENLYISKSSAKMIVDIDEPIFYQERINAILTVFSHKKIALPSTMKVDTNIKLEVDVFSDKELQEAYSSYATSHIEETKYIEDTTYFFDDQGNCAKVTRLPSAFKVDRPVVFDYYQEKDYLSEMTQEDFTLVNRILTLMKERLMDYLTWSKQNVLAE